MLSRKWGHSWSADRTILREYPSERQALVAADRYIMNKVRKGYYQLPYVYRKEHTYAIGRAMELFPLLERDNNIIAAEINSSLQLKGLHLRNIKTFTIRRALLNKKTFRYLKKLECLRVGESSIWNYRKQNKYKDNFQKLFQGKIMVGDAFEFLFLLDYLDHPDALAGVIGEHLLNAINYSPCGFLEMIVKPHVDVDRKTAIDCEGCKSWVDPPEYFPVIRRGHDGCTLGLMIDDGIHYRGLVESCAGYSARGSMLHEFQRSLDIRKENSEFVHLYSDKEFIQEGRFSIKGYIEEECYSEEFCYLVSLLTNTYLSDNKIMPSSSDRTDTYIFNCDEPSKEWSKSKKLFTKGSTDGYGNLGLLVDPDAYFDLPEHMNEKDLALYYLGDAFGYSDGYILNKYRKNRCRVPCDYIPKRSYPLFRTRQILNDWLTQNLEEA